VEATAPLRPGTTGLLVIDIQQPLLDVMWNRDTLLLNAPRLIAGARLLGVPIVVTEQNPTRLGATVPPVAEALGEHTPLSKMSFSCCGEEPAMRAIEAPNREAWLLCGVEAHVCVSQTALDLLARGHRVHVVSDATGSRTRANREAGLERVRQAGAVVTTTEMALFELLGTAEAEQFKAVQRLIR
jgi:nicotinamidase-related amidase